ncbi:hypothetical protein FCM35_KLT17121 [Carex littledalei]|uniref:Uncharacterized protein n=1 Tax=Carex littledalei TaxID=544730 RepID=A0A833RQG5_9POAL|nr:hypothetical protein FCM35_KLT17121 [Carex littledalei]
MESADKKIQASCISQVIIKSTIIIIPWCMSLSLPRFWDPILISQAKGTNVYLAIATAPIFTSSIQLRFSVFPRIPASAATLSEFLSVAYIVCSWACWMY